MNETVCGDGRVERRSAYGGDASLVLSQIHRKNLREQRRGGDRFTLWDFFFSLRISFSSLRCLSVS